MTKPGHTVVMLVGMHRSGTSLAAQAFARAGLPMGQALVTRSVPDNDLGFWEDRDIVAAHDDCLRALSDRSTIWDPVVVALERPAASLPAVRHLAQRLDAILDERLAGSRVFGFKDPRSSYFIDIWRQLSVRRNFRLLPILLVRRAGDVRASLQQRQALPAHLAELMWLRSLLDCLEGFQATDLPALFYEDWLVSDGRVPPVISGVMHEAGLETAAMGAGVFVLPLRHHAQNPALLPVIDRVYDSLRAPQAASEADRRSRTADMIKEFIDNLGGWASATRLLETYAQQRALDPNVTRMQVMATADDSAAPQLQDVRSGICTLHNGNPWCVTLANGAYQLHANRGGDPAAALSWRMACGPGPVRVEGTLDVWHSDAIPLVAHVQIAAASGAVLAEFLIALRAGGSCPLCQTAEVPDAWGLQVRIAVMPESAAMGYNHAAVAIAGLRVSRVQKIGDVRQ